MLESLPQAHNELSCRVQAETQAFSKAFTTRADREYGPPYGTCIIRTVLTRQIE